MAAARAGGVVTTFVGALGDDESGELLGASLGSAGVDVGLVERVDAATGAALISVTPDDENTIIVAPGANGQLRIGAAQAERLAAADVVLASWMYRPTSSSKPPPARTPERSSCSTPPRRVNGPTSCGEHRRPSRQRARGSRPRRRRRRRRRPADLAARLLERVPAVVIALGGEGSIVATREGEPPGRTRYRHPSRSSRP